jgi:hypothetical protein
MLEKIDSKEFDILSMDIPSDAKDILSSCPRYSVMRNIEELIENSHKDNVNGFQEIAYDIPGKGRILEAYVCRVNNGIAANYTDPYMRRRDPDCVVIGDDLPSDKPRFFERFGYSFDQVRQETFEWLKNQELVVFFFIAGGIRKVGMDAMVNVGFFALGLALLQGIKAPEEIPPNFKPRAIVYVAPPFRHTHFQEKQIVVHYRHENLHELFSYNLYPGPSAKKGIYGVLIRLGETEGWLTTHCSTVQVVTPYDNVVTFMHEGASGGGKSEMLEYIHREYDGRILLGENTVTEESRYLSLPRGCDLRPVTDDMALCHPSIQQSQNKLTVMDAEQAWFVRVNHISEYGIDPHLEKITIHPRKPLLFLNIDAKPNSTALIWEHIEDAPGEPCPNPRVILPREVVPNVIDGPVTVDVRSFGIRTPPCTKDQPTYGIIGLFHILPPALAWLWRLVTPRGHENPSIIQSEGMESEGVGSYWPFATGEKVAQANLFLDQFMQTTSMIHILCPNQHIGAWKVGFTPQWITREYLARRGNAQFHPDQIIPAICPLLGYIPKQVIVEGSQIPPFFLNVASQPEGGLDAYNEGSKILKSFFHEQLQDFYKDSLHPLGKQIIECCLLDGTVSDYTTLLSSPEAKI